MFIGIFWWFTDGFLCSLIFRQSHKKHLGDITNQNWGHVRKRRYEKPARYGNGILDESTERESLAKWNNVSQHGHFFSRPQTTDSFTPCSTSQVKSEFGVTETSWILAIILATPILEICWPQGGWHFKDTSGTAIGRLGRDHWKDQDARRFHQHHRHWELKEMRRKCCSTPLLNVKIW